MAMIAAGTEVVVENIYGTYIGVLQEAVTDAPTAYQKSVLLTIDGERFRTDGRIIRRSDWEANVPATPIAVDPTSNAAMARLITSTEEEVGPLISQLHDDRVADHSEALQALSEVGYGDGAVILCTITLSGGGPSSWLEARWSKDATGALFLERVEVFAQYGEGKSQRSYDEGSPVWSYAFRMTMSDAAKMAGKR